MKELDILSFKLELADLLDKFNAKIQVDDGVLFIILPDMSELIEYRIITPKILRK